jgi:hypothetical protein
MGRNETYNHKGKPRDRVVQVFFAFPPKAQNLMNQAGLLARLTFVCLLILDFRSSERDNGLGGKSFFRLLGQTYSCGDSFGFTPNSLLIPEGRKPSGTCFSYKHRFL